MTETADALETHMRWTELFASAGGADAKRSEQQTPRLGIDFVQASAPEASVAIAPQLRDDATAESPLRVLTVQQSLSRHGIAGVVWNCARALVSFVQQQHPTLLAKKRVLELGAGTGIAGLALAAAASTLDGEDDGSERIEPAALLLTDLADVVPLTDANMRWAAQSHPSLRRMLERGDLATRAYCWGDALCDGLIADVVLASDCLYEPTQYAHLLASLLALTNRPGVHPVTVVLAYKQRLPDRERAFFDAAAKAFAIAVDTVDATTCAALGSDTIHICTLTRRSAELS